MKKSRIIVACVVLRLPCSIGAEAVPNDLAWDFIQQNQQPVPLAMQWYSTGYGGAAVFCRTVPNSMPEVWKRNLLSVTALAGFCLLLILLLLLISLLHKTKSLAAANHRLENFNQLIATFVDADTSFVFLKDKELRYVFVNQALRDYYQLTDQQLIGKDDFELLDADLAEMCTRADRDALDQHKLIISTTSWNGQYFRTTKFPVKMQDGSFGVGAYISDVTEEYQQQCNRERMLRYNKLLLEALTRTFRSKQEQLDYVTHQLLELTGSAYGYIYFYDEDKENFTLNSWTKGVLEECTVQERSGVYKLEHTGIWGEVVRQRKAIVVNDFASYNPLKKGYPKGHVELSRFMSIPVMIDDRIVAVAGLANKQTDYDDTDAHEITMLMSGVWNAVQRREAMETLAYERNKYLQILLSIGDGVMVIDRNQKIEMLNTVAAKLTGWTPEAAIGVHYKEVLILSHEQGGLTIENPIEKVFRTGKTQGLGDHAILMSKEGVEYYVEDSAAPIQDEKGSLSGVVLVFRDVSQQKEQRKKIEYMSYHDALTGLYNRHYFEEELYRIDTDRHLPISILMGDVNSLKLTNDIFGHNFGDMLLRRVAEVMKNVCRTGDMIARWGGDEFVLLLPGTSDKDAQAIAKRIKKEVSAHQIRAIRGSISIGTDTKVDASQNLWEVLNNAEEKMYSIKTLERSEVKSRELDNIKKNLFALSPWDKAHAERVGDLCHRIGRVLGLSPSELQRLTEAGQLHDIGKITLEPRVLQKGGPLSAVEQKEMNQHPVVGYRILNSFDDTLGLSEIVLAHHEYWDGSGYPKGLAGEEIPLPARILSLVESYDHMLYPPHFTQAKSHREAVEAIRLQRGILFDPRLVDAFIQFSASGGKEQ